MEGSSGFVTWQDVTSDVVQGENATFYYLPTQLEPAWPGSARRIEVKFFQCGRVTSNRDKSATIYVEFILRGKRKRLACIQGRQPTLVILKGWGHPDPPDGWVNNERGGSSSRFTYFATEWRAEMDNFLSEYLQSVPGTEVLADYREAQVELARKDPQPVSPQDIAGVASETAAGLAEPVEQFYPDEVSGVGPLSEGAVKSVVVNAYERNSEARQRCIAAHQPRCYACEFDFGKVYGLEFAGFIHVHHLRPLSEVRGEYVVDPVNDLRPVCPNCHAVIHHGGRLRSIEEVRQLLIQQGRTDLGSGSSAGDS